LILKNIFVVIAILCIIGIGLWGITYTTTTENPVITDTLRNLALQCYDSHDVPVAALVLYNDSIIGVGFNQVNASNDVSAHAEIIALKAAGQTKGLKFIRQNTDHIKLVSTFQPCLMCADAIQQAGIKNIVVYQNKSFLFSMKEWLRLISLKYRTTYLHNHSLQDSLFRNAPGLHSVPVY
jgi:tRNA(Arg) A34 adenosine deaminase TadA